ncbi:sugar transferase [Nonlabens xiamenensis]|uniref:sugar transferase n=1 Tax=Nonlabens xiamenensis TaxID=2341043 RepID=UPI000F6111F9|nr:sugar transferase [Nonlabens xiamenensis]
MSYTIVKRLCDIILSAMVLLVLTPFLFILCTWHWFYGNVFFTQERIGRHGKFFKIIKFKTMSDGHVTKIGRYLRRYKIDELPQFINIMKGEMSVVGPRPDLPGYYDRLSGKYRDILCLRPGLTSLAALKYSREEYLLENQLNPLEFNDKIIFPDKVRLNYEYLNKQSFFYDLKILLATLHRLMKP